MLQGNSRYMRRIIQLMILN
ncbi:hypothetical protein MTR67_048456 [Solanum verrucosum]|uniref:Uncharacterized protein n=1 Tax=Solanum verrucosum TaxID=315347 RepID=A0AAF0V1C1_SOLVR|nr:hypothetical protein MTR67_048456 [Solanum verrucosum]